LAPIDWWPFLIVVFLVGLLWRAHPLTAIAVMLMLVSLAARWWTRRALNGVVYRRRFHYDRGYPGETLDMTVEAENRKFLPVAWLRAVDTLPTLVGPEDDDLAIPTHIPELINLVSLYSLRWWERDRRSYRLLLRQRGVYRLGPARLESGDLFGVFETARDEERLEFVTVFPQPLDFESLALPTSDPFGDRAARRRLFEDPNRMMGVRDYQPEDDFRRIHWPATARTGELQVKVYQPVSARVMVVCLNVMTMPRYYQGADPELLEHLVRVAASVAERGLADGYQVGLLANTSMAHADQPFRIPPGRSPGQYMQLLTALAGVTQFSTGVFDRFLIAEAPRLPYGATLVVITGPMSLELRQVLMNLRGRARRVLALVFEERKPLDIPGVDVYHRPFIPEKAAP
jgi:uncharacterized protein (DUF58 family)